MSPETVNLNGTSHIPGVWRADKGLVGEAVKVRWTFCSHDCLSKLIFRLPLKQDTDTSMAHGFMAYASFFVLLL